MCTVNTARFALIKSGVGNEGRRAPRIRQECRHRSGDRESTEIAGCGYEQGSGDGNRDGKGRVLYQPYAGAVSETPDGNDRQQAGHHGGDLGKGRGHLSYLLCLRLRGRPNSNQATAKIESGHQGVKTGQYPSRNGGGNRPPTEAALRLNGHCRFRNRAGGHARFAPLFQ
jgi:hypothetical protein